MHELHDVTARLLDYSDSFASKAYEVWAYYDNEGGRSVMVYGKDPITMPPDHFVILAPSPGLCQVCADEHAPDEPHDPESVYWRVLRAREGLNKPTWEDALGHCPEDVRRRWTTSLKDEYGYGCPECGGWKFTNDDYLCATCRTSA
jgi:hypothetical protein